MKKIKILVILAFIFLLPIGFLRVYSGRNPFPIIFKALPISSKILGPPKGYVYAKEKYPQSYTTILPSVQIQFPPFPFDEKLNHINLSEVFVLQLENARVYGNNGLIITNEDKVLADTAIDWIPSIRHNKIFRKNKLPKLEKCDETIAVIASKSSECFYHWMIDILPRLELLQRAHVSFDKIYLNPLKYPFQQDTIVHLFKQLGIEEKQIIWANEKTHICAKKLIIPSVSRDVAPWVCNFLNEHFLKTSPLPKKRIYISRKAAPRRKITNETELVKALEKLGFEEVLLENLNIFQQAELFASAECIVAPHGAGLTNLVFCHENTRVIEMFNPNYLNVCYWSLSHIKNLNHSCILGSQEGLSDSENNQNDMWVNVEEVISHLR